MKSIIYPQSPNFALIIDELEIFGAIASKIEKIFNYLQNIFIFCFCQNN